MKKLFAILLAAALVLSLAACGNADTTPDSTQNTTQPSQNNTQPSKNDATEGTSPSQNATEPSVPAPTQGGNSADVHTHIWDYAKAQITKQPTPAEEGSQSIPCESCSEILTESVAKMSNDAAFQSKPLGEMVTGNEKTGDNCLTAEAVIRYMQATGDETSVTKSAADFFAECGKHFALTDSLKAGIKAHSGSDFTYDSASDAFTYQTNLGASSAPLVRGFEHNSGNKYTVYYSNSSCGCWVGDCMICLKPFHFKVELELNRTATDLEAANKILTITKIASLPDAFVG